MSSVEVLLELIDRKLDLVLLRLEEVSGRTLSMSAELDTLKAQIERNTTVTQSAITLINGLAAQIADLKDDPVMLQKLADDLKSQGDALAAAVSANTPVAP